MKRMPVVLAALAVVCIGAWLLLGMPSPWLASAPPSTGPTATQPSRVTAGQPTRPDDAFALTVDYVYDGDTIRATAEATNDIVTTTEPVRIRLIGIDTPEGTPVVECWADEARAHLEELLPEGSTVWAAPDRDPRDRYGRLLLYLWTSEGTFVNHALVAAGDAEAIRVWPNVAHADLLRTAQHDAESDGRGRWGAC